MTQDIRDFLTASCELLALGEPTHREPAFTEVRNELFVQLVEHGFRSIALETDRVAALMVDDFVQDGMGTLDAVMREGFSHNFGHIEGNRQLVAWMREYNEGRPVEERLTFHGFDASTETMSAPSPRRYLEYTRDYLGLDLDLANLTGDDERWSRTEAVVDPAMSPGDTPEAVRLRVFAAVMLTSASARAPERMAATSRAEWFRAQTYLTAGLGLLRYHKQSARRLEQNARISLLGATRDALMAQNLLDIRALEARRGPTLVFAHNFHLQRSLIDMPQLDLSWVGAGAIVESLWGERYVFVAGSIGRSEGLQLGEPEPDTYEGVLQKQFSSWGVTKASAVSGRTRTDTSPMQAYFPLEQATLDAADAVLHIKAGTNLMPADSGLRMPG